MLPPQEEARSEAGQQCRDGNQHGRLSKVLVHVRRMQRVEVDGPATGHRQLARLLAPWTAAHIQRIQLKAEGKVCLARTEGVPQRIVGALQLRV